MNNRSTYYEKKVKFENDKFDFKDSNYIYIWVSKATKIIEVQPGIYNINMICTDGETCEIMFTKLKEIINNDSEFKNVLLIGDNLEQEIWEKILNFEEMFDAMIIVDRLNVYNLVTQIPIMCITDLKKMNDDLGSMPYVWVDYRQDEIKYINEWFEQLTQDINKLCYPTALRIKSEELSCKMIDITENNDIEENKKVKIKIL